MPNIIGGLLALIVLSASVLQKVDPEGALIKGAIAFMIGKVLTKLWLGIASSYQEGSQNPWNFKKSLSFPSEVDSSKQTPNSETLD